jgi:hypothetical protein
MDTDETNINHKGMSFTITEPLGRQPTFAQIQMLASQHDVHIRGNGVTGDFGHPNFEEPKVTGNYAFGPNGDMRGDFNAHIMGKLAGQFAITAGKIEVTIAEKPFLLPEGILKSKLASALKEFSAKLNSAGA